MISRTRFNRFCLEKNDSEAAVVSVLGPSSENDNAILCKSFQVAEMLREMRDSNSVDPFVNMSWRTGWIR